MKEWQKEEDPEIKKIMKKWMKSDPTGMIKMMKIFMDKNNKELKEVIDWVKNELNKENNDGQNLVCMDTTDDEDIDEEGNSMYMC